MLLSHPLITWQLLVLERLHTLHEKAQNIYFLITSFIIHIIDLTRTCITMHATDKIAIVIKEALTYNFSQQFKAFKIKCVKKQKRHTNPRCVHTKV